MKFTADIIDPVTHARTFYTFSELDALVLRNSNVPLEDLATLAKTSFDAIERRADALIARVNLQTPNVSFAAVARALKPVTVATAETLRALAEDRADENGEAIK